MNKRLLSWALVSCFILILAVGSVPSRAESLYFVKPWLSLEMLLASSDAVSGDAIPGQDPTATADPTVTQAPVNEPTSLIVKVADTDKDISGGNIRLLRGSAGKQLKMIVHYSLEGDKVLDLSALPEGADITIESDDPSKVAVTPDGMIKPVSNAYSTANIKIVYHEKLMVGGIERDYTLMQNFTADVVIPAQSVSMKYTLKAFYPDKSVTTATDMSKDQSFDLWIGDKITLIPTVLPADTTDKTLIYESSNPTAATVSAKGVVTVKNMGDTIITGTAVDAPDVKFSFSIHCYKNEIDIVKDMGAIPDDGATDLTPIKKALAQAQYLNKNDRMKVTVPDGTYDITSVMTIYSHTDLILSDKATIKRLAGYTGKSMLRSSIIETVKGYDQFTDVNISGGVWDGNADGSGSSDLIYLGHGKDITMKNMTVKNTCGEHLIELAGIKNATLDNVEVCGYVLPAKADDYTALKEAIQLDYCSSSSTPAMKPHDLTECKNITIKNCRIHDYMCGIGTHGASPKVFPEGITITGNIFSNITNICVDARNFKDLTVSDNKVTGFNEFLYAAGTKGSITGNTIENKSFKALMDKLPTTSNGIEMLGSELTITKNTIDGAKANGIYIGTDSTAVIKSNKIYRSKKYGIYTYKAKVTLKSNTLSENKKDVYHTSKKATIKSSDDIRAYYVDIKDEYKYTGKKIKPVTKIKGLNKKYYSIKYKNNKKRGTATVKIKGKDKVKKTLTLKFKII